MAVKVREVNIEKGHPPVDEAMRRMVNGLTTAKREGIKSVVLIHGYGSSGEGGAIKLRRFSVRATGHSLAAFLGSRAFAPSTRVCAPHQISTS